MAAPVPKPPVAGPPAPTMGNAGGAVRGQARAAQVQARNAARRGDRNLNHDANENDMVSMMENENHVANRGGYGA